MLHNGPLSIYMNRVVYWLDHIAFDHISRLGSSFARITPSTTLNVNPMSLLCVTCMKIISPKFIFSPKLHFLCFIYVVFVVKSIFHIIYNVIYSTWTLLYWINNICYSINICLVNIHCLYVRFIRYTFTLHWIKTKLQAESSGPEPPVLKSMDHRILNEKSIKLFFRNIFY